jgi:hypothetical protein
LLKPDRRALAETRARRDQEPFLPEGGPAALCVLDQLVGLADPYGAAAAFQPIVEDDAGDLATVARAGAVTEHPTAAETNSVLGIVWSRGDGVEGLVGSPRSGGMACMGLAGIDHALEFRIGQKEIGDQPHRQTWLVGGFGRCHGGHGRRLDEPGRMRLRSGNTDRLQGATCIKRIGDATALGRLPLDGLGGEFDAGWFGGGDKGRDWPRCANRSGTNREGPSGRYAGGRRRNGRSRRNLCRHPRQQRGRISRHPGRDREGGRIVGRDAVDGGQARVDDRSVTGIDAAIDGSGGDDATAFLRADEAIPPGRTVGRQTGTGDRDEPPAFGKAGERGGNVAECRVGDTAPDRQCCRERRIHQHDAGPYREIEMVVDVGRVVPRDGNAREELIEQGGSDVRQFIQNEGIPGKFGEDGEKASAGREFKHEIGGRDRSRGGGGEPECDRRGKSLKRLALFGVARMRRTQGRGLREHCKECRGRGRAAAHAGSELA